MPVRASSSGLRLNDELPFVSAALVDVGNARNGAQQRLDRVFLNFAQLEQLLRLACGFCCRAGLVGDVVVKNFAQDRC